MQDFSDFRDAVRDFMDEYGAEATYITQMDVGSYDPATATNTVNIGEFPVRAIMAELSLQSNGAKSKYRTVIREGDKMLYVEPTADMLPILFPSGMLEVDPTDDRIILGGVTYKVVTAKVVDPTAGLTLPILWELYVRR